MHVGSTALSAVVSARSGELSTCEAGHPAVRRRRLATGRGGHIEPGIADLAICTW